MSKAFRSIKTGLNQALAHASARTKANSKVNELKVTEGSGNVFPDIGFPPDGAANLYVRASLIAKLMNIVKRRKLTKTAAAKLFGITQARSGLLLHGRIREFTIDSLVEILGCAGITVERQFVKSKEPL